MENIGLLGALQEQNVNVLLGVNIAPAEIQEENQEQNVNVLDAVNIAPAEIQDENQEQNVNALDAVNIAPAEIQEEIPVSPGLSNFGSDSSSGHGIKWKLIETHFLTQETQLKQETFECGVDYCPARRYRITIVEDNENRVDYIEPAHQHEDEA